MLTVEVVLDLSSRSGTEKGMIHKEKLQHRHVAYKAEVFVNVTMVHRRRALPVATDFQVLFWLFVTFLQL